jgi:multisubunit Na+/H+ antiporter MnhC subunit
MDGTDGPDRGGSHNYVPWINVVLGLLVFTLRYIAPRGTFSVHWNLFLTGIVIMFAALATTISHGNSNTNYWSAINVAAGVWLLISAQTIPTVARVTVAQDALGVAIVALAVVSLITEAASRRSA